MNKMVKEWNNVHMVGIRGAGLGALAEVFLGWGMTVTGSDTADSFSTDDALEEGGVVVAEGFSVDHLPDALDAVVRSVAYGEDNPEVAEALRREIPVFTYPEVIGMLFQEMRGIAVAGTHGKSTTTAMLGVVLEQAGLDPTVIVGATVKQWGRKTRVGKSEWLVAEADEYRRAFHHYRPFGIVITNIDYDHSDVYITTDEYQEAFRMFQKMVNPTGFIIGPVLSAPDDFRPQLKLPGEHSRANAFAAFEAAVALSIDERVALRALEEFKGVGRRFDSICERRVNNYSVVIVEDYAHHPTEVRATIQSARDRYPYCNIWAVFQPHTFTRTEKFFHNFITAFKNADRVFLADIYASAREKERAVTSVDLAEQIGASAIPTGSVEETERRLSEELATAEEDIVILVMGAGDIRTAARGLCICDLS